MACVFGDAATSKGDVYEAFNLAGVWRLPVVFVDTNVVSDLVRRPGGEVARRAASLEPGSMAVSVIVAVELRYGAERRGSARLTNQLEAVLTAIETLPLAEPADRHYGVIRSALEARRPTHRPQ